MKKALTLLILGCSILSFTACSNSSTQVGGGNSVNDNTQSSAQQNNGNIVTDDTENNIQEEANNESASTKVSKNSTLTMSNGDREIEYTLTDVCFMNEVHSNSDNMFASYFPDKDDESYVVAKITIKNVGGDSIGESFFDDIEVTFDGKFKYRMQQLDLESSVMSQFWSCQPLKTVDIYWVQSVPDEVKSMGCNISFKVGKTTYTY